MFGRRILKSKDVSAVTCSKEKMDRVSRVSEWDGSRDKRDIGEGPAHVCHLNSNPSLFCSKRE